MELGNWPRPRESVIGELRVRTWCPNSDSNMTMSAVLILSQLPISGADLERFGLHAQSTSLLAVPHLQFS